MATRPRSSASPQTYTFPNRYGSPSGMHRSAPQCTPVGVSRLDQHPQVAPFVHRPTAGSAVGALKLQIQHG